MKHSLAEVVSNRHLTGNYWLLELDDPEIAEGLHPGQFVNIKPKSRGPSVYLRRPFSVYRVSEDKKRFQIAYKIIGDGTRLMSELPVGGRCDLIGPLGRGFHLPAEARNIAVIGRGIGTAALVMLVDQAARGGMTVHGFLSAKTMSDIVARDVFEAYEFPVVCHTDERNPGTLVTDPLVACAQEMRFDAFYVCGSNRLARVVHALAQQQEALAEIAMEQHMACGFGDCHGCVIQVNVAGAEPTVAWREVCHYGPVFETWEVADAIA